MKPTIFLSLVLFSAPALAGSASFVYGLQTLQVNDLIDDPESKAREVGVRLHLPISPYLDLGFSLSASQLRIEYEEIESDVQLDGEGLLRTQSGGPEVILKLPWNYFSPYWRFAYLMGALSYGVTSRSSQVNGSGAKLETALSTIIQFQSRGPQVGFGVKIGSGFRGLFEVQETHAVITMKSLSISSETTVDGEVQPVDAREAALEDIYSPLVGKGFGHSSRSILGGFEWEF